MQRGALVAATVVLLSALIPAGAPLAEAQGLSRLRNFSRNVTRSVRESVRSSLRILPRLGIVRGRAGPVAGLRMNDNALLLVLLRDDSARLWDLRRGVQLGGAIGGGIVVGAVRGAGGTAEVIAVRRNGSSISIRPDGAIRPISERIVGIDRATWPVLSADGGSLAFRLGNGEWRVTWNGRTESLPDASPEAHPILSRDGARVIYRTIRGTLVVKDLSGEGADPPARLGGCAENTARVTAGAFKSDGSRAILGDEHGGLCVWSLDQGAPQRLLVRREAHSGGIHALAVDRNLVATAGEDGSTAVWSIATEIRRVASLESEAAASGPLLLDATRGWVLLGEENGTVGVYSLEEEARIAGLISMDHGWAVVDRKGRFDGTRNGVDSLVWAGATAAQTLPVDAFSESYFEPGLLAKLDDASPIFLNEKIDDLSEEGYIPPPSVSIGPVDASGRDAGERLPVTVRIEPGYKVSDVSKVRLYHNGKLAGQAVPGTEDGVVEYTVRLLPGENTFAAVGVGPGGIEGPKAEVTTAVVETAPLRPGMQVVSVGINDYDRPWSRLSYSRRDAVAVTSALRDRGGKLFADVATATLLDSSADRAAIEDRVLQRSSSPRDILVVYLAGHGIARRVDNGWEWYFITHTDAWRDEPKKTDEAIRRHGLSGRRLMDILTKAAARRVFLILDSCRSGAIAKAMATDDAAGRKVLRGIARVGGLHVLAASREDTDAAELRTKKHGALTYLVLEGLRGGADGNRDGTVTVREIVDYAEREMPSLAERFEERVQPSIVGYWRGEDFALVGL